MFKIKHISLNKSFTYFLICPCDEHLVVIIGFLSQTNSKIDRYLQVHSLPVCLKQYAQFLCSSKSKYRNQNFATTIHTFMYLLQEVSFSTTFGISNCRGICRFTYKEIWATFVNPSSSKMTIWCHVVVTCIHNRLRTNTDPKHSSS